MLFESARVENFKCIDDSTEFGIRRLTALVGKNESGKTALLKALYRINPILPVDGDFVETEYPRRRWSEYRRRRADAPDRVVTVHPVPVRSNRDTDSETTVAPESRARSSNKPFRRVRS